jgi:hypothetical protein
LIKLRCSFRFLICFIALQWGVWFWIWFSHTNDSGTSQSCPLLSEVWKVNRIFFYAIFTDWLWNAHSF